MPNDLDHHRRDAGNTREVGMVPMASLRRSYTNSLGGWRGRQCLLLALLGRPRMSAKRPLSGVMRTLFRADGELLPLEDPAPPAQFARFCSGPRKLGSSITPAPANFLIS